MTWLRSPAVDHKVEIPPATLPVLAAAALCCLPGDQMIPDPKDPRRTSCWEMLEHAGLVMVSFVFVLGFSAETVRKFIQIGQRGT